MFGRQRRRYRPGTVALREIRKFQKSTDLLIPKAAFQRVVRQVFLEVKTDIRCESLALLCLQEAAEAFVVQYFEHVILAALHRNRKTVQQKDGEFIMRFYYRRQVLEKGKGRKVATTAKEREEQREHDRRYSFAHVTNHSIQT